MLSVLPRPIKPSPISGGKFLFLNSTQGESNIGFIMTADREADVVLVDDGNTRDGKPMYKVVVAHDVPPVVLAKSSGNIRGEFKFKVDDLGIVRPMRDSDIQSIDLG